MSFHGWDKITLRTAQGEVPGIAPVIISASRATDIAAFYADEFMHDLRRGFVKWINPFNRKPQYVSFEQCRVIVFWTKNAQPLLAYLPELDRRNLHYYFTYTLNDYEREGFEPHLPPLASRIATFRTLSARIGKEKVIWRFDPLILTDRLTVQQLLSKIYHVGEKIYDATEKLVVSFIDIQRYRCVRRNLAQAGLHCREFTPREMTELAAGLQEMNRAWHLEIATCAEEINLSAYGIQKNHCIDGALLARLFPEDTRLMRFLTDPEEGQPLFAPYASEKDRFAALKDKGQRKACLCLSSKDIGCYNTCPHLCVYCYANSSAAAVQNAIRRRTQNRTESAPREIR